MTLTGHRLALALFAGVIAIWLIGMAVVMRHAALPPEASGPMLAVFEPGTPQDEAFSALARANARIVKQSGLPFVWVVAGDEPGLAGRLTREGALGAYRELPVSPVIAGCFAFADAKVASLAQ
ncbi:hypothetical protein DK847_18375 [Aestuariivirga litoralis]|uniref:Uncharacterized protein n=1 Tax=Aestuariivirga litoralis TaxID=2650924 RepID=A0A2W2C5R8_9HYPH|nr:hypothetical protein [Aestuariivirga litoralis]PZF75483.1 hypothetical protein DK847_18375 [Aestuariivirga litoralis]